MGITHILVFFSVFTVLYDHYLCVVPEHSIFQKEACPQEQIPPPPTSQPLTNRNPLSVSMICLFWTFPISGIMPRVSCLLLSLSIMFSGSVHVAVSVRASLLSMAEGCFRVWRDHLVFMCLSSI